MKIMINCFFGRHGICPVSHTGSMASLYPFYESPMRGHMIMIIAAWEIRVWYQSKCLSRQELAFHQALVFHQAPVFHQALR